MLSQILLLKLLKFHYKVWFPLSQLRPRQRPIQSENKAISVKDDCSIFNRFVFVSWSWHLPCDGNRALGNIPDVDLRKSRILLKKLVAMVTRKS